MSSGIRPCCAATLWERYCDWCLRSLLFPPGPPVHPFPQSRRFLHAPRPHPRLRCTHGQPIASVAPFPPSPGWPPLPPSPPSPPDPPFPRKVYTLRSPSGTVKLSSSVSAWPAWASRLSGAAIAPVTSREPALAVETCGACAGGRFCRALPGAPGNPGTPDEPVEPVSPLVF